MSNLTATEAQRFQELKEKGFVNLLGEEKKEYQTLLALEKGTKEEKKTITMTEDQLKSMIASEVAKYKETQAANDSEGMEEALRFGKWIKNRQPKKANPVASLRVYRKDGLSEPGIIIDWKFVKNVENPETKVKDVPVYQIEVLYDDDKHEKSEITLNEMVQLNEFEKVEIIKQDVEDQKMISGTGRRPYTANGYSFSNPAFWGTKSQVGAGEEFEYEVHRKDVMCTVKRPNGNILQLHSSRLNQ